MSDGEHTFLFADMAGFTALTEAHGDEDAAQAAAEFCEAVRRLLPDHRAHEVKTIGDEIMVRVGGARDAIELGLRIVDEVGRRPQAPVVRVGMHTGTAIERDGDWFGATVNLAARVSGEASGGQVLLTEATRSAAGALHGIELRRHGERRFRHVREAVLVHRALRVGAEAGALEIDPVCRMAIGPGSAAGTLCFRDREHRFCSLECARAFAAEPERYVEGAPG